MRVVPALFLVAVAFPQLLVGQASPPTWKVTQDLRIDGTRESLASLSQVIPFGKGMLAVVQQDEGRIRWYDSTGKMKGSFGRKGEGPNEFRAMTLAGKVGDSIWVGDISTRRTTTIGPNRSLVRIDRWPSGIRINKDDKATMPTFMGPAPWAVLANGDILASILLPPFAKRPPWYSGIRGSSPLVRVNRNGLVLGVVAVLTSSSPDCAFEYGPNHNALGIPYCRRDLWALADSGGRVAIVVQENATGRRASYRLFSINSAGDTILKRSYEYTPVAIPQAKLDSAMQSLRLPRGSWAKGVVPPEQLAAADKVKPPTTLAPIGGLVIGRDDTIWLAESNFGPERSWIVLDGRGEPIGNVRLPRNITLVSADRHTLWGTMRDEDDVESVVRYRIVPQRQ